MCREYVAIGTTTSAWQKVNMTRLTEGVHALLWLLLNTHAVLEHTVARKVTSQSDQSRFDPPWRGVRLVKWQEGRCASTSLKTDRGDTGRLGDRPGPFTINKTCSIPSVITGSSTSSSLCVCKPVFTPHKVEALLPELLSYIKGNIKLHSRFMLQGLPNEKMRPVYVGNKIKLYQLNLHRYNRFQSIPQMSK